MLLRGILFDADGNPMSPTFTHGAGGKVYRYYVSTSLQCGAQRAADDEAIRRVPADAIEKLVEGSLAALKTRDPLPIGDLAARVEIHPTTVQIVVRRAAFFARAGDPITQIQALAGRLPASHRLAPETDDLELSGSQFPAGSSCGAGAPSSPTQPASSSTASLDPTRP